MTIKMNIPPDAVESTRMWFRDRGGVILWHDQEIGGPGRPEVMTPRFNEDGTAVKPPHWSMGEPEPLSVSEIQVRTEQIVEPPLDWFPVCTYCEGTGRYAVSKIALARGHTEKEVVASLTANNIQVREDQTITCSSCQGTGHTDRTTYVAVKSSYGRHFPRSKAKAEKLAAKLGPDVKCDYQYAGNAKMEVIFYREQFAPFTLE